MAHFYKSFSTKCILQNALQHFIRLTPMNHPLYYREFVLDSIFITQKYIISSV